MNITFETKEVVCGSVFVSWFVRSPINDYRATIEFCGGIDEDGEENLYFSANATITIDELKYNTPMIFDWVSRMVKDEVEVEVYNMCSENKEIRLTMQSFNESSYDDTMKDFKLIIGALATVLIGEEIDDDIDNPISDYSFDSGY